MERTETRFYKLIEDTLQLWNRLKWWFKAWYNGLSRVVTIFGLPMAIWEVDLIIGCLLFGIAFSWTLV